MIKGKLAFTTVLVALSLSFAGCHSGNPQLAEDMQTDSIETPGPDSTTLVTADSSTTGNTDNPVAVQPKKDLSTVLVYNFHVTNRCPSCIAIEDATTKTLNTYFAKELKQGRIKRQILNVDDDANSTIAEKYQAFGSGMFVTRVYKGKETTTDLTGDGFKYAKNKEERFIEILKTKITEYLK